MGLTVHAAAIGSWLMLSAASCARPVATPSARPTLRAGPEQREQAACLAGRYPPALDASALARAKYEDIHAQRSGDWSTFATARLLDERAEFDARCAQWRQAGAPSEGDR